MWILSSLWFHSLSQVLGFFFLSAGSLFSGGFDLNLKLEIDQVGKKLVSLHSRIIRLATSGDLEVVGSVKYNTSFVHGICLCLTTV